MEYTRIKRIGRSHYARIPYELFRALQLEPDDIAIWGPDGACKVTKKERLVELLGPELEKQPEPVG